jgi:hypothetical protein
MAGLGILPRQTDTRTGANVAFLQATKFHALSKRWESWGIVFSEGCKKRGGEALGAGGWTLGAIGDGP